MFVCLGVLLSKQVHSQSAGAYLDSTSTWYELFGGTNGITMYKDYNTYFLEGDTVLSGTTYYRLYRNQIDSVWDAFTDSFLSVNYNNHVYQGALREDSLKRFHLFYPSQAAESMLFDFNFSISDSLSDMIAVYGCNNPPQVVTSIDSLYLGTTVLKRFHFPPGLFNKTLYEGIGCSGGLIWYGALCQAFETGGCLIAYKKGTDSLYFGCGSGVTAIKDPQESSFTRVYPNPASDYLTVTNIHASSVFSLYNLTEHRLIQFVFTGNGTSTIDIHMLPAGIYTWVITEASRKAKPQKGKVVIIKQDK